MREKLENCPTGQKNFSTFEGLGIEVFESIFGNKLGKAKQQSITEDKTQRRDVLFRNNRSTSFFKRIDQKFNADFIIVDFKNYGEEVDQKVLNDVTKYANKTIGNFILIVSRKGAELNLIKHQIRILRDKEICILVIGDEQLLEMTHRQLNGEEPEDLLEDMLDDLLLSY